MKKMKAQGFARKAILLSLLGVAIVALLGYVFYQNYNERELVVKDDNKTVIAKNGTIEGSLTYPADVIPAMTVYAEDITTGKTYSSDIQINDSAYTYGVGYKIEVPAGSYYVYGTLKEQMGGITTSKKAYYNEYVACILSNKFTDVSCEGKDTAKKTVVVKSDETTNDIGVGDWWND